MTWSPSADEDGQVWWHAYQAEIPDLSEGDQGALLPALCFTVIGPTPQPKEEAPRTHSGRILGHDLTFQYVTTWDHQPSDEEKEAVQPTDYRRNS